jgi:hypothetical protein
MKIRTSENDDFTKPGKPMKMKTLKKNQWGRKENKFWSLYYARSTWKRDGKMVRKKFPVI